MRFRRTTLIIVFCAAILAGLGLSRHANLDINLWFLVLVPLLFAVRHKNATALITVIATGLIIGCLRGDVYVQKLDNLKQLTGQKVTVQVTATSDAVYGQKSQMEFTASNAHLIEPSNKFLAGSFKISGFGVPMVYRGDIVRVTGKLFPMRGSNQARIAYAQLERVAADKSWVNIMTRKFAAGMQTVLPEPQASFGLGLLIGQRTTLPQTILDQLTLVGLVHIVAVSGYNVTILARAVAKLKLPSKFQRLALSLTLIGLFILVTGFSASIVRAAIVSLLTLWAWFYGRRIRGLLIIFFTAALTGLVNPFYVWSDLGWYLSFLAFFGVLVLAPILSKRFFKRPPKAIGMVLLETFSAEVMTLPLIMMTFGKLSLIGLLANLLVVPLVSVAMLLCAVAGVAGALIPQLAGWLAWPATILLTYILDVVHLLSKIPSASVAAALNTPEMIGSYALILLIFIAARRKTQYKKHPPPIK